METLIAENISKLRECQGYLRELEVKTPEIYLISLMEDGCDSSERFCTPFG